MRHISKHDSYRLLGLRIVSKKGSKVFTVHSFPSVCGDGDAMIDLYHPQPRPVCHQSAPATRMDGEHGHSLASILHIFTDQLSIN